VSPPSLLVLFLYAALLVFLPHFTTSSMVLSCVLLVVLSRSTTTFLFLYVSFMCIVYYLLYCLVPPLRFSSYMVLSCVLCINCCIVSFHHNFSLPTCFFLVYCVLLVVLSRSTTTFLFLYGSFLCIVYYFLYCLAPQLRFSSYIVLSCVLCIIRCIVSFHHNVSLLLLNCPVVFPQMYLPAARMLSLDCDVAGTQFTWGINEEIQYLGLLVS